MKKLGYGSLLVLALVSFFGISAASSVFAQDNHVDTIRPDAPTLAPYGSYSIGVKTLQFINPGQLDIVKAKAGETIPIYNRPLTVEVWYPAIAGTGQTAITAYHNIFTRDGKTLVDLYGKAVRSINNHAFEAIFT